MKNILCLIGLGVMLLNLFATTYNIKLDGSGDFTTIQAGISVSQDNDTILVYPGTYLENIDFSGKNITVGSLYLTTQQESYRYNTVIDGNQNGSCVQIKSGETNAHLVGFTLTNGNGSMLTPSFNNFGGGCYVVNSSAYIIKCRLVNNSCSYGGGLFSYSSNVYLEGCSINGNVSEIYGGGILSQEYSTITFSATSKSSIYNNYSALGQDIDIFRSNNQPDILLDTLSVTLSEPDNYHIVATEVNVFTVSVQHQALTLINNDLYISPEGNDANSGLSPQQPWRTIARAMHLIESDSLNPKTIYLAPGTYSRSQNQQIFPVALKSYVSIVGDSADNTVLDAEQHMTLIHVNGEKNISIEKISLINSFCIRANIRPFNISFSQNIFLSDIIFHDNNVENANALRIIQTFNTVLNNIQIFNQTASNGSSAGIYIDGPGSFIISNVIFNDLHSDTNAGGLVCLYTHQVSGIINNCIMSNNTSYDFGVFQFSNSDMPSDATLKMSNCLIFNNDCQNGDYYGGVVNIVNIHETPLQISNCTIANNTSIDKVINLSGKMDFNNIILYNPAIPKEMYLHYVAEHPSTVNLNYSCLRDGIINVYQENGSIFNWGPGNITSDPGFIGGDITSPDYYQLATGSPCINTGTPDTTGLAIYPSDLNGNPRVWNDRIDMGCYEYDSHGNEDNNTSTPDKIVLRNYPNPIRLGSGGKSGNPYTFFEFTLKEKIKSRAVINIYNIKGQRVRTLDTNKNISDLAKACGLTGKDTAMYNANSYSIVWDAKGDNFKTLPTGVYVYILTVDGKKIASNKCLILK